MGRIIKNKLILSFFLISMGIFAFGLNSLAADNLNVAWPKSPFGTELTENSIPGLIKYLYEWGFGIAGLAVFIVLLIAGVQYLTSAGDAGKMKEAMDRIKSAILGLVLLLSSVLILNTINPQLTTLKMPPLKLATSTLDVSFSFMGGEMGQCEKAVFYKTAKGASAAWRILTPSVDQKAGEITITEEQKNLTSSGAEVEINSIEFFGDCFLILYPFVDYESNNDNPPIMITAVGDAGKTVQDIKFLYGKNMFRSAKISNASQLGIATDTGLRTCTDKTPACLYSEENSGGDSYPVDISLNNLQSQYNLPNFNNKTKSVKIKSGYAVVLHDDDLFRGSCLRVFAPGAENLNNLRRKTSSVTLLTATHNQPISTQGAIKLCPPTKLGIGNCVNINGDTAEFPTDSQTKTSLEYASRIELAEGYSALLFEKKDYGGECRVVTESSDFIGSLSLQIFSRTGLYRVSSVQIVKTK